MYILRRIVQKWTYLAKSLWDATLLSAGLHLSRLKVLALLRCEKLANKQMRCAGAITLNLNRP
jgi:hypothetical protein